MEILTHSRWVCSAPKKITLKSELSKNSQHTAVMGCTLRNGEQDHSSPWFKDEPQNPNVSRTLYDQYPAPKLQGGYNLTKCHKTQVLVPNLEVDSMRKESERGWIYNVDYHCLLGPSLERQEPWFCCWGWSEHLRMKRILLQILESRRNPP